MAAAREPPTGATEVVPGHAGATRSISAIVCLLLTLGTLLAARPPEGAIPGSRPPPWPIAWSSLAVPVSLQPAIEIRRAAFFAIIGAALLSAALRREATGGRLADLVHGLFASVLLIALISASWNHSWGISSGWLLQLAAGWAWCAWCASRLNAVAANRIGTGVGLLLIVASALTLGHRWRLRLVQVEWPIGSVTTCGFVAAVGAAFLLPLALTDIAGVVRKTVSLRTTAVLRVGGLAAAIALLVIAGRQGAVLAFCAAAALALAMKTSASPVMWRRFTGWLVVLIFLVGATAWIALLARPGASMRRGSILTRFSLYRETFAAVAERPLLGFGPDTYAQVMATRLAPRRAESPATFHADLARAAHHEWLQALMELGVVGGAAYALVPIVLLARAWRAFGGSDDQRPRVAAAFSAVVAVVVAEASSTSTREPTGAVWYWGMLGLLAAVAPAKTRGTNQPAARWTAVQGTVGVIGLMVAGWDVYTSRSHAIGLRLLASSPAEARGYLAAARHRFDAMEWLLVRRDLAAACQEQWQREPLPAVADRAVSAWRDVWRLAPGLPDAGPALARCLEAAGDAAGAMQIARETVERIDPYDPFCNLLLGRSAAQLSERAEHACRAVRNGRLDGDVGAYLGAIRGELDGSAEWRDRVRAARQDVATEPEQWRDPLAPEVIRVEAWRLEAGGALREARDMAAAATYPTSALHGGPRGRGVMAEVDAWTTWARLLYAVDPRDYRRALEAIQIAEERAVLTIPNLRRRVLAAGDEVIGDEVDPLEFPEQLESMWATSATLHLAAGRMRHLPRRIMAALPAEQRTPQDVELAIGELAWRLHNDFAALPASERPANYGTYLDLVSRHAPERLGSQRPAEP